MQEHRREKRIQPFAAYYVGRNHSILPNSFFKRYKLKARQQSDVVGKPDNQEDDHINQYEEPRNMRWRQRGVFVSKRDQGTSPRPAYQKLNNISRAVSI